jgi:hypothetical protein
VTRGLTPAVETAVQHDVVHMTLAGELDFASGFVRAVAGTQDVVIGGNVFAGLGGLVGLTTIREPSDLQTGQWAVSLTGVPADAVSIALNEHYQGRPARIWALILDPSTLQPIPDPIPLVLGRMDQMLITYDDSLAEVKVTITDHLADWDRPRLLRWTHEDQQLIAPGDRGLEFVPATAAWNFIWPTAAALRAPPASRGGIASAMRF